MAIKVYDEVLGKEVLVQELITPDIMVGHPHDEVIEEIDVEVGDDEDE